MRRWTLPSRAEQGRVILSGAWTTSTCYKPREIERIQTQDPHFQRLVMSRKQGVGQIIKASVTVVTRIALTGGFRVIKATLDDLYRLTRGARHAVGPAQLADHLITLHIIDEMLNVDLHGWTPVRDRGMRCRQFTPSSHATTLESNKSVKILGEGGDAVQIGAHRMRREVAELHVFHHALAEGCHRGASRPHE